LQPPLCDLPLPELAFEYLRTVSEEIEMI
jgi:hypothetical protein